MYVRSLSSINFISPKMDSSPRGSIPMLVLFMMVYFAKAWSWNTTSDQAEQVQVPCFFIFGDSLVDNGNNNNILTLARANYPPYGVDFPEGVTGRFTNGQTFVDALAKLLGFTDFIPPFASARRNAIPRGVNFASGAAGIRDETGNNLGAHVPMNEQVSNFARTVAIIRRYLRGDTNALQTYLSKCIFFSGMGSNDYLNNFFMTDYYRTSSLFTPAAYANSLLQDYSRQLMVLYQLGARKVVLPGVGQIGCIPYELARFTNTTGKTKCNEEKNNVVNLFNSGLRKMVDSFNNGQLPGAKFVYLDSFQSSKDLGTNPRSYGFEVVDEACCGVGKNNGQITCLPLQPSCDDHTKYVFWDAFHPTDAANALLAKRAYTTKSKSDAYPINVKQLAML